MTYIYDFHNVLINWIGLRREPVVMDIATFEPVWNYPAYRYRMNIQDDPYNSSRKLVTCTVWFADDVVPPDFVGTSCFTKVYTYNVTLDENGYAVKGNNTCAWVGGSITNHPDFIWYPTAQRAETGCPLEYDIVKEPCCARNILLVDDDNGANYETSNYETYYMAALDANGYDYDYCHKPPAASLLLKYPVVIWLTGNNWTNTLTPTDQENLQMYLDHGGNLFISGQDIGWDLVATGDASSRAFYYHYLDANYIRDDTEIYTLNGVTGDPIGDGLTIGISGGDGADNQNYQSEIAPRDAAASAVFTYAGDGCGAIKADSGTYKVVYFAFGFEAINNAADRNTVMDRVMRWLMPETAITSCEELQNMKNDLSGNYYLVRDIDCSDTVNWNSGAGFVPIGNSSNPFTGTFDGKGHKITGLYINRPSTDFVGLFGCTDSGSEIRDVGLENIDVTGNEDVGGLVGQNRGNITNSYSTGSISGNEDVGGLVGYDRGGTIAQSYSTGNVNGGLYGLYVGGLAGYADYGTVSDSYSTSSVSGYACVGGLIGYVDAIVTNTYSTGSVSGTSPTGGLIGVSFTTIHNSYWDIETSGQSSSDGGEGKTTAEMKQQATFVDWDFVNVWDILENETYPFLRWQDRTGPLWTRYSPIVDNETEYLGVGGIAIDSDNNVIVTSNRDILKYTSEGALLWRYRNLCAWGVAVDKTDDSIIVGLCDPAVVKFDKNGYPLWTRDTNEPVNGVDSIAVNSNGDILVAGTKEDSWDLYWEIMDRNGNYLYSITRPHAGWYPAPTGTFDNAGNVFIARGSTVEKLTPDLHSVWNITVTNCDMEILSLSVDSNNNLLVHGKTRIGGSGSNSYTGKYNGTNGDLIWERIYDSGYMDGAGFSTSLIVDHADNVFVAGTTDYETGNLDKAGILIIKYNGSDGTELNRVVYRKSVTDKLFECACEMWNCNRPKWVHLHRRQGVQHHEWRGLWYRNSSSIDYEV